VKASTRSYPRVHMDTARSGCRSGWGARAISSSTGSSAAWADPEVLQDLVPPALALSDLYRRRPGRRLDLAHEHHPDDPTKRG
jgi:hypothetical protein